MPPLHSLTRTFTGRLATAPLDKRTYLQSVALFESLNGCVGLSDLPHPVVTRNGGLQGAWMAWIDANDSKGQPGWRDGLMRMMRRRFNQNVDLFRETVMADPLWRAGGADPERVVVRDEGALVLPTAGLMYWSRPHLHIEATDALEQLLVHSDIGIDLPVELFQPPAPACFVRFGKAFQDAVVAAPRIQEFGLQHVQGVYVFDSRREIGRSITLVPVFALEDMGKFGANTMEIVVNDDRQNFDTHIALACRGTGQHDHFASITQIVAKIFFYMQQSEVLQIRDPAYSQALQQLKAKGAKKAAKLGRHLPRLYDRVLIGPSLIDGHDHGELSPHLRRGHFRMQPYGPQSALRKVIFVAPTWVRPDRLKA